jgi:glycosyl transferase family 87
MAVRIAPILYDPRLRWAERLVRPLLLGIIVYNVRLLFAQTDLADFGSFVAAARAAGQHLDPYARNYPLVYREPLPEVGQFVTYPNLNPPASIPFFHVLLSQGDPAMLCLVWRYTSLAVYIGVVLYLVWRYPQTITRRRVAWAMSLGGLWYSLWLGQVYCFLLPLCVLAWELLRSRRPVAAGAFIGLLVAMKPSFAVWPLFLLLVSGYAAVLSTAVSFSAVSLLPILLYGSGIYPQWLAVSRDQTLLPYAMIGNSSLGGLAAFFDLPRLGMAASVMMLVVLACLVARKRPTTTDTSALAIIGALLASPVTWPGYTMFLLPALLTRRWNRLVQVSAAILAVPVMITKLVVFVYPTAHWLVGWLYGWALLLILADVVSTALVPSLGSTPAPPPGDAGPALRMLL